jgi:hypothetical protein
MGRKGTLTAAKRQREIAVANRRKEKQERRTEDKPAAAPTRAGEDPDLAGIRPGPQAPHAWQIEE